MNWPSLKFWANQLQHTIVAAGKAAWTTCSACWASSSPRPDRSTSRLTP